MHICADCQKRGNLDMSSVVSKRRECNSYVGVVVHGIVIFRNWNWISSWNSIIAIGKGHYCIAVINPRSVHAQRGYSSQCVCVTHDLGDKITLETCINRVLKN